MAIDVWFPLAIYYVDLPEHTEHNPRLLDKILQLHSESGKVRTNEHSSWTGDIHRVDQLHNNPDFDWLTEQIQHHGFKYLRELGHDLDKIDLYVQRSWPIIAGKGQKVAPHSHHNANLSAVYFVQVPKEGSPGQTRFFNDARANELSDGLGTNMTEAYSQYNPLNFEQANYDPVEGRLLMFPAKQRHDVAPNETDDKRVSISFDLVITAKSDNRHETPEFLMPSPDTWRKLDTSGVQPEQTEQPEEVIK